MFHPGGGGGGGGVMDGVGWGDGGGATTGLQPLIFKFKQFTKTRLHWKSDFRLEVA